MNLGLAAGVKFLDTLSTSATARGALTHERVEAVLFASAPFLSQLSSKAPSVISIGAQNVHWEATGAFTGEISASMLKESNIEWALCGHSERRQFFGETNQTTAKRAHAAVKAGLRPVLCVGETRAEREAGKTNAILDAQITAALEGSDLIHAEFWNGRVVIAYEPVWAIGTGLTATPEQAQEAHAFLRTRIAKTLGVDAAAKTLILYGGSVTPENIEGLLAMPDIDGGLVGGASTDPLKYAALLAAAAKRASST